MWVHSCEHPLISCTVRCQDPHGELQGQNVLIVRYSVELTAARFGISVEKVNELLASARAKMAEVRKSRPRPHLDTKMLASWNGKCLHRFTLYWSVILTSTFTNLLYKLNSIQHPLSYIWMRKNSPNCLRQTVSHWDLLLFDRWYTKHLNIPSESKERKQSKS